MHGAGGEQCDTIWIARYLAGRGYVAVTLTHKGDLTGHVAAAQAGVDFLRSSANPYRSRTDRSRLGLIGFSQGSTAVAVPQQTAPMRAIVAFDALKGNAKGDSASFNECANPDQQPIRPRVPALSLTRDSTCFSEPDNTDPQQKKTGHRAWKAARVSTMTLSLRGFEHPSFTVRRAHHRPAKADHLLHAGVARPLGDGKRRGAAQAGRPDGPAPPTGRPAQRHLSVRRVPSSAGGLRGSTGARLPRRPSLSARRALR